jgi:hypothetical protein
VIYTREEWTSSKNEKGYEPYKLYHPGGVYWGNDDKVYTDEDKAVAWRRDHPIPPGAGKPPFETIVGKYLICSQFSEPRYMIKKDWHVATWDELDDGWWFDTKPRVSAERFISWGHSTWLVNPDGTLAFSGADYDSSG